MLPNNILKRMSTDDRKSLGKAGMTTEEATEKQEAKTERELQNQIANWLRLKGIHAIRSRMDRKTTNQVGTPDFIFAVNGRAVALEVKLPGRKLRDEQQEARIKLMENGWYHATVHTLDEAIGCVVHLIGNSLTNTLDLYGTGR